MPEKIKKRYSLPEGQVFRVFGSAEVITNDNINDADVEALIAAEPSLKKIFIDSEIAVESAVIVPPTQIPVDLTGLTKKELHAKYLAITGKNADEKLNHEKLVALVKAELDALEKL